MVTPQDYIKRFFAGAAQRNKVLIDKFRDKLEIDERIQKKKTVNEVDIVRLTALIGEDNKLRIGRLEDQSIRYLLWKSIKSANFLEKWKSKLVKQASAKGIDPDVAKTVTEYIGWIYAQLAEIKKHAILFEGIYAEEVQALKTTSTVEEYLRNVEEEVDLLAAYYEFRENLAQQANTRLNKIAYFIKRYKGTEANYKVTAAFLALMALTLGLVPLVFPPKPEEAKLFPAFAAVATVLWAAMEGKNILADIQTTLEAYQKEVWTD
ncbi:hypothetical protein KY310_03310 [Candidatus Woesearchaeota archaeon]|nr:hypothetical protein [Candidatus Woesearchaeota archaeon]